MPRTCGRMGFKGGKGSLYGKARDEEDNWRGGFGKSVDSPKPAQPAEATNSPPLGRRQSSPRGPKSTPISSKPEVAIKPTTYTKTSAASKPPAKPAPVDTRIASGNLSLPGMPEKLAPESQAALDALCSQIPRTSGTAWVPMLDTSEVSGWRATGSFFGGNQVLMRTAIWPVCIACKSALTLVCQIDRASLLHPLEGSGLVQVFACTACAKILPQRNLNAAKPSNSAVFATFADLSEKDADYQLRASPKTATSFPLRRIVKWLPRKDFAHPEEVGKILTKFQWQVLAEAQVRSDKAGGFACWLDGRDEKCCKVCKQPLRLLVQIDSGDNVPFIWGNDGCIAVFECADHPEQVTALLMSSV